MRSEFSDITLKHAIQLPVTIIQHAGPAGIPSLHLSSAIVSSGPSTGGPAPDHLLHRLWKHSPYCLESPKHGVIRRVNGHWVHEKSREV